VTPSGRPRSTPIKAKKGYFPLNFQKKLNFKMKKNNIFSFTAFAFALLNLFSFSLMVQSTPIGNLLVEGVGEIPTSVSERLDQYQNLRSAGFADWDACELC
jgi:hypothetical protein